MKLSSSEGSNQFCGPSVSSHGPGRLAGYLDESHELEIGKAALLQDGDAATLIACGVMVSKAIEAAQLLEAEHINVRVLDMATIKPLDIKAVLKAAQETGAIVTAEEHNIIGGLGSAVAEVLVENDPIPMERLGVKDTFGQSGKPDELLKLYELTAQDIVGAVKRVIKRKA